MDDRCPLRIARKQVLLAQPQSKYPPIQEQAFEEDKGVDLIERLGKIDAFNAREEQRVKTTKFIEQYETIRKAPELKGYEK
jgi:hypothetical protein